MVQKSIFVFRKSVKVQNFQKFLVVKNFYFFHHIVENGFQTVKSHFLYVGVQ